MKLVDKVAIVLAILAVLSASSIALSVTNYLRGMSAARGVQLELTKLELRDGGNPEVHISFYLKNGSPINTKLEAFRFSLYLNEHYIGGNYVPPPKRSLDGFEETSMGFVIPIQPFYLRYIAQARQKEEFSWFVRGKAKLLLPFREEEIWLNVREHWSGP